MMTNKNTINFKKGKMLKKVSIPISALVLIIITIILLFTRSFVTNMSNKNSDELIKSKVADLQKGIDRISEKALYAASICSNLSFVNKAYQTYNETNDLELASSFIEKEIDPINNSIEKNTGVKPKIHYHLPPARSFIRCWSKKRGDDISDFRNTVLEISKSHKPIGGIEVGRGGFVIRGLAPIFSETNEYYGSVEILLGLDNYLKMTKNREDEEMAIFMDKKLLQIATGFLEKSSSNVNNQGNSIGNYILVDKTSDKIKLNNINADDLANVSESLFMHSHGDYKYGIYPIKDFDNNEIGLGIYQLDISELNKTLSNINLLVISLGVIAVGLLVLLILYIIYKYISAPISKALEFTSHLAEGNLNHNIDVATNDEIGQLLIHMNIMKDKIKYIVKDIYGGARNLLSMSEYIRNSSQQIAQSSNEQASSIEEVSSTMEEMSANIEQNTLNAQETKQISIGVRDRVVEVSQSSVKAIESSKIIAAKIGIINEIAFQTNILALNAAVEAARAGEHGKGFAVVASEVRKLAERSKHAADEIVEMTQNSLNYTESAGNLLRDSLPDLEKSTNLIQEIASAGLEQNNGATQVNTAVQVFSDLVQKSTVFSDEMSGRANELLKHAGKLKDLVSFFKLDGN